jgi:hypothetical protein
MNCREYNFPFVKKSFFFSPLAVTNISYCCFRFIYKGRLFAKQDVDTLQIDPGGLIFTGDRTGLLAMWKWLAEPQVAP